VKSDKINSKLLLIPQSGFNRINGKLYTVHNRGKFYEELALKYEPSTILYTLSSSISPDNKYEIKNCKLVMLKENRSRTTKNILKKLIFIKLLFKYINKSEIIIVFIPNKTAVLSTIIGKILKKKVIIYVGGDWKQISLIPYKKINLSQFSSFFNYCTNAIFEFLSVYSSTHVFVAGRELLLNLQKYNKNISELSPMICFNSNDVFFRNDTFTSDKINIIFVGYLTKLKGITYLLEAFQKITKDNKNCFLNIVGDGELYDTLKYKYKNKNIIFHGYVNDKEKITELYKNSDVFVFPSLSEGFPRVIYEAMLHSIPIITTDVGGLKYFLINYKDAIIIDKKSSDAIYTAFYQLKNNESLRKKIIFNARNKVVKILKVTAIEQYMKTIKNITEKTI
jgi:glycosyltransferase involved in cell wall biosynthesis